MDRPPLLMDCLNNTEKMAVPPKQIYRVNAISIKLQCNYSQKLKKNVTFNMKIQKPRVTKTVLSTTTTNGITTPDFKIYFRAIVLKKKNTQRSTGIKQTH